MQPKAHRIILSAQSDADMDCDPSMLADSNATSATEAARPKARPFRVLRITGFCTQRTSCDVNFIVHVNPVGHDIGTAELELQ